MSRKPKVFDTLKLQDPARGQVNVGLGEEGEVPLVSVVSSVRERLPGFFDCPDRCEPFHFDVGIEGYSAEDGFPAVLDLSPYFSGSEQRQAAPGKSIFLTEYERLRGELPSSAQPEEEESFDQIEAENWKRIKQMDAFDLERARQEIYERLDAETIEFLKKRGQQNEKKPKKVSHFKQQRSGLTASTSTQLKESAEVKAVRNLEVISDQVEEGLDSLQRLAMDPMHMDFASKYMRSVLPRQEENMVQLFEKLKLPFRDSDDKDALVSLARRRLSDMADLYLEEFVTEDGKREKRFGKGVNPIVDGAWSLMPIRRVVDAFEVRGEIVPDDVDIVQLALLFTVLLLEEQPRLFQLLFTPGQVYCHLAEVFLLGTEVFKEDTIGQCVRRLLDSYLFPKARQGLLSLRLSKGISGLDAFFPFYDDLLKRFLEFSLGDELFSLILLIPPYMNSSVWDALALRILLWSNEDLIRQLTLSNSAAEPLLKFLTEKTRSMTEQLNSMHEEGFTALLVSYRAALDKGVVTESRNPTLHFIARQQLECCS